MYKSMIQKRAIRDELVAAFPSEPAPGRVLWNASGEWEDDIGLELLNRVQGKGWIDVSLLDWSMVGASPAVSRSYIDPSVFVYYLPSILIGAYENIRYLDFALDSLLPSNKERRPRGEWWFKFHAALSEKQRQTIVRFLERLREEYAGKLNDGEIELILIAEQLWSAPRP